MHIYESPSMMLGPLLAVSSWQRGTFPFGSEWSQPSSHYFASEAIISTPPTIPQTAFLRAGILALSLLKKDQTFFSDHVTTFSQVLKCFYIRPPLSPTPSTLYFTFLPLNGHFHLKDAWCLSDSMWEMVLSLSPSGGNGFWVAGMQ